MPRFQQFLPTGALCLVAGLSSAAQTFQPKAIHFKGVDAYSDQELLSAIALRAGSVLATQEVNADTQKLIDTGLFASISYKFDGSDLVFQVKTSEQPYPVRLENIPLIAGQELDAKVRERVPLYRGKVPSDGGLLNQVRAALEDILKAQSIPAIIQTAPYAQLGQGAVSAISFTITSPRMLIGEIQSDSSSWDPDVKKVLGGISGSAYDCQGSAAAIVRGAGEVYRGKGYLDAEVDASQLPANLASTEAVRIPFRMSVTTGPQYRVESIHLAPDLVVSQADFDKQAETHPGDVASAEHIAANWHFIERQYHNRGFMRAQVMPIASRDPSSAKVTYSVTAVAGPVFTMGKLTIENVSDDLRAAILKAWKMPEGSVFNEGAIVGFFATSGVNPQLERIFATVKIKYDLHPNDDSHTVDTTIRLERKP
jgi:outer membrane protein assembly factor BamA